jgi:hypothetical protein
MRAAPTAEAMVAETAAAAATEWRGVRRSS